MFIEAIPVAVMGILFALHILLFSWKYVPNPSRTPMRCLTHCRLSQSCAGRPSVRSMVGWGGVGRMEGLVCVDACWLECAEGGLHGLMEAVNETGEVDASEAVHSLVSAITLGEGGLFRAATCALFASTFPAPTPRLAGSCSWVSGAGTTRRPTCQP